MKISELIKPAAALITVTAIAAALLGYVHAITLKPIAAQQQKLETEAISAIFKTSADTGKEIAVPKNSPITRVLEVYSGGSPLGYAIFTSAMGYSGPVSIVAGIDMDGVIKGVRILDHTETPGLGANAENPEFTDQYIGKSGMLKVTKSEPGNNDIQAITSATITSNAVTAGVNGALSFYWQKLSK